MNVTEYPHYTFTADPQYKMIYYQKLIRLTFIVWKNWSDR